MTVINGSASSYADGGFSGVLAPSGDGLLGAASTVNVTANRALFARVFVPVAFTCSVIAFVVTTAAGSDDACDVGIYNSALTTKIVSSGATTGKLNATTGVKTVSITPTTLAAGTVYYVAFACGAIGTTAAGIATTNIANLNVMDLFGNTAGTRLAGFLNASYPLPADGSTFAQTASVPRMALRTA